MLGFDINVSRYCYFNNNNLRTYLCNTGERSDFLKAQRRLESVERPSACLKN